MPRPSAPRAWGLGQEGESVFERAKAPHERLTLREWVEDLLAKRAKADFVEEGVSYVNVVAPGPYYPGQEVRVSNRPYGPKMSRNLLRYGGHVPHPTRGAVLVAPWVFDPSKSPDQLLAESDAPNTFVCVNIGCLDGAPFQTRFDTCRPAFRTEYNDVQVVGRAKYNRTAEAGSPTAMVCGGIGARAGGEYRISGLDGTITFVGTERPSAVQQYLCPSSVLLGRPTEGETAIALAALQRWAKEHQCTPITCRRSDRPSETETFVNCPVPPPPPPGAEEPTGTRRASLANVGLVAAGLALAAYAIFKPKGGLGEAAAAEGRRRRERGSEASAAGESHDGLVTTTTGAFGHERKVIKRVPDAHAWLNRRYDNDWRIYDGDLKPGTYAMVGGSWTNVKKIDPFMLGHV